MTKKIKKGWFQQLKGRIIHKDFIGFDTETYINKSGKQYFRLGSFIFPDGGVKVFNNRLDMINFLFYNARLFQGRYIVATNLQFDLTTLFFNTTKWKDLNLIWSKDRLVSAYIKLHNSKHKGKIVFIDTLNFNAVKLSDLGKIVNISKISINKKFFKKKKLSKKETNLMTEYNINDSKISQKYMYHFQNTLNSLGGNLKITIASCSLDLYRRKFMPIMFIKERNILNDNSIEDFVLKSYFGGRCEAFAISSNESPYFDNVFYYDVNSLYPSVMLNLYPIPQSIKIGDNTEYEVLNYMGVTECAIECPKDMLIPILPIRTDEDKIFYPTGILKGVWTNLILKYALENGYKILSITKQYIYTECMYLFKDYVNTLYKLRQEYKQNGNIEEQTIKLCLNSLYGKFGQKPSNIYKIINANDIDNNTIIKFIKSDYDIKITDDKKYYICSKKGSKYPNNSFPILASYVTSYGQILLHKIITKYKPLYVDTDSIITQEKIESDLISNTDLGKLKLEKLGRVEIYAPKNYAFNNEPTLKGIKFCDSEDKYKIFKNYNNGMRIEQERFIKLKSSLRSIKGISVNQIIKMTKCKKLIVSDKRIFINNYSIPINCIKT